MDYQQILMGAALGLVVTVSVASGATVRLYTPGGSPCAGACSLEWAAAEFGVPVGEPRPMTVPAGSFVYKMSYAKGGKPYWFRDSAIFSGDQPGVGYEVTDESGRIMWMVKIDECENWALVTPPTPGITYSAGPAMPPFRTSSTPPGTVSPPPRPCVICEPPLPPPPCILCEPPPPCKTGCEPPPAPVPLPASFWALAALLGLLGAARTVQGRQT